VLRSSRSKCLCVIAATLLITGFIVASRTSASADTLSVAQRIDALLGFIDEADVKAPIDYGPGPGLGREKSPTASGASSASNGKSSFASTNAASNAQIPTGDDTAAAKGVFGAAVTWPIIPIHVVLLPDGRVMNYGTNALGQQGAQFIYDIWDPTLGTDTSAHLVLQNTTGTDIFCSAQSVLLAGEVLTTGGDLTVNGVRNSANNKTTLFSPSANTLTTNTPMTYARWYDSLVALPNGQLTVFGGRQNVGTLTPSQPATMPELYDPALKAWTTLTGANSVAAFGTHDVNWFYPRSFVAPGGNVFVMGNDGLLFYVSTAGAGKITRSNVTAPLGDHELPTVSFAPGMALSLRSDQQVVVVDFRASTPIVTPTDSMDQVRFWASGTILADGKVLVTGGSEVANELTGVAYQAQIWDPRTGHWAAGATATKPRLYHSNSLLLPDASVLTGGGGAPGPVINLNSEIYYPPYLYAADGSPAVRPVISATSSNFLNPGDTVNLTVGATDVISRLTLVRTGSATHSGNSDQRFIELTFNQAGQNLTAALPPNPTMLLPGYYMLFAFNNAGVPSTAAMITVAAVADAYPIAATPTFSPIAGVYQAAQSVSINDATPGVTIYYTTNGAAPSTTSSVYAGAIAVSSTTTLKAKAMAIGYGPSAVATAAYTIRPAAATPTFSPVAGVYQAAQSVSISDTTPGVTIYYTTDGTVPTTTSSVYSAAISVSSTTTLKARATATGYGLSPVATAVYTIRAITATPILSPVAGLYHGLQSISITDATPGATIYYTTNGTVPTTASSVYGGAITVSSTTTLKAKAMATGYGLSPVASALYTIRSP
jgi:Domain of unknown function (DUF1929)/Chitobiase/beta-hexosaminidase C-terminal domain